MTTLIVVPVPVPVPEDDDDDNTIHKICCEDDNVALCGEDVTDHEWAPAGWDGEATCAGCRYIENRTTWCPVLGACLYPHDPL